MKRKKKWIQKSVKKPGALRRLAIREKAITQKGTIALRWLKDKATSDGKVGKRAKLALMFRRWR